MFIIGNEELNKRKNKEFLDKNNTEIFFITNYSPKFDSFYLENIEPIFNFDRKDLKYFEIKINDILMNV